MIYPRGEQFFSQEGSTPTTQYYSHIPGVALCLLNVCSILYDFSYFVCELSLSSCHTSYRLIPSKPEEGEYVRITEKTIRTLLL